MSRQDIYMNPSYGECNLTDNLTNKVICPFELLEYVNGEDNDNCCFAEITLPVHIFRKIEERTSIYTRINYIPSYKKLYVRLRADIADAAPEYIRNKSDNSIWIPVLYKDGSPAYLSGLITLNEDGYYNLQINSGYLTIFSGGETDFEIKASLKQNEVFLLKCFAGNLYQFPTTGVGLIEFLHGNFQNSGLAEKLQQEFENDKMIINDAYMDSVTGELYMEVTEKNG